VQKLTFVLCSRNDGYGGNSLWRLQTTLNFLGHQAAASGRADQVEVIVSDWGSANPLRTAVRLSPEASGITRFLEVPADVARARQKDSVFAEVIANNAAIRRATGDYIARIDQDTLVGLPFLSKFSDLVERATLDGIDLRRAVMFVGRRSVPFAFTRTSPELERVLSFVNRYGRVLPREGQRQEPWFDAPVGAIVLHRDLWQQYRGYDESLLYWGFMETDLVFRLASSQPIVDLDRALGCDFFHLAHSLRRKRFTSRRKNPRTRPSVTCPNDESWGLRDERIESRAAPGDVAISGNGNNASGARLGDLAAVAGEIVWEAGMAAARAIRAPFVGDRVS
jgi:hypothetical protein